MKRISRIRRMCAGAAGFLAAGIFLSGFVRTASADDVPQISDYALRLSEEAVRSHEDGAYALPLLLAREAAGEYAQDPEAPAQVEYALQQATGAYAAPEVNASYQMDGFPVRNIRPAGEFEVSHRILDYWTSENGETVTIAEENGNISAWDIASGRKISEKAFEQTVFWSDSLSSFEVIHGTGDQLLLLTENALEAFDPEKGEVNWRLETKDVLDPFRKVLPCAETGEVFLLEYTGGNAHITTLEEETGKIKDRIHLVLPEGEALTDYDRMLVYPDGSGIFLIREDDMLGNPGRVDSWSRGERMIRTRLEGIQGLKDVFSVGAEELILMQTLTDEMTTWGIQLGREFTAGISLFDAGAGEVKWSTECAFSQNEGCTCRRVSFADESGEEINGFFVTKGDRTILLDGDTGEILAQHAWLSPVAGVQELAEGVFLIFEDGSGCLCYWSWLLDDSYIRGRTDPLIPASLYAGTVVPGERTAFLLEEAGQRRLRLYLSGCTDPAVVMPEEMQDPSAAAYVNLAFVSGDYLVMAVEKAEGVFLELFDVQGACVYEGILPETTPVDLSYEGSTEKGELYFTGQSLEGERYLYIFRTENMTQQEYTLAYDSYASCLTEKAEWIVSDGQIHCRYFESGIEKSFAAAGLKDGESINGLIDVSEDGTCAYVTIAGGTGFSAFQETGTAILNLDDGSLVPVLQPENGKIESQDRAQFLDKTHFTAFTRDALMIYTRDGQKCAEIPCTADQIRGVFLRDGNFYVIFENFEVQVYSAGDGGFQKAFELPESFAAWGGISCRVSGDRLFFMNGTNLYEYDADTFALRLLVKDTYGYADRNEAFFMRMSDDSTEVPGIIKRHSLQELLTMADEKLGDRQFTEKEKTAFSIREKDKASAAEEQAETKADADVRALTPVIVGSQLEMEDGFYTREMARRVPEEGEEEEIRLIPSEEKELAEKKESTIMIYMIGSNLESRFASATKDLREMRASGVDFDKVNVVALAGGCTRWNCNVATGELCLLDVSCPEEEWIAARTEGSISMGKSGTLSAFLNYCTDYYPAEHYSLICWDHGGGPLLGYGSDELFDGDSLLLTEMAQAMENTGFDREHPLDLVGFDACLMGNLETAVVWRNYAEYMIGSEELEAGDGWDYSFLDIYNETTDPLKAAGAIMNTAAAFYGLEDGETKGPDLTLSCLKLSETERVLEALEALSERILEEMDDQTIPAVYRAADHVESFGKSDSWNRGSGYDQLDLRQIAQELSKLCPEEAKDLSAAVQSMVEGQVSSIENTGGVSLYFPVSNPALYEEVGKDIYGDFSKTTSYLTFLKAMEDYREREGERTRHLGDIRAEGEEYILTLDEEMQNKLYNIYYTVLKIGFDEENWYPVIRRRAEIGEDGAVHIPADPEVFSLKTEYETDTPWFFNETGKSGEAVEYDAVGLLLSAHGFGFSSEPSVNAKLQISSVPGEEEVILKEISSDEGESSGGKSTLDISHWRGLNEYLFTKKPLQSDQGEDLPWNAWQNGSMMGGYVIPLQGEIEVIKHPLSFYDGQYYVQVTARVDGGSVCASNLCKMKFPRKEKEKPVRIDTAQGTLTVRKGEGFAEITGYEGNDEMLVIPEEAEGLPVTGICRNAFSDCASITGIQFPETLTMIEAGAFRNCTGLSGVSLPDSLQQIGTEAFAYCEALKEVSIGSALSQIGNLVFWQCTSLEKIEMAKPSDAAALSDTADAADTTDAAITADIMDAEDTTDVMETSDGADTAASEEAQAAGDAAVPAIFAEDNLLYGDDGKTVLLCPPAATGSVVIREGTEVIETGAFMNAAVSGVSFPEGLLTIENGAFWNCRGLKEIVLPESLTYIGIEAFANGWLDSLYDREPFVSSVKIGKNVTYIGKDAFSGYLLDEIIVDEENETYGSTEGFLTNRAGDNLLQSPMGLEWEVYIPEEISCLSAGSFSNNAELLVFHIPETVTRIEEDVFKKSYLGERPYVITICGKAGSEAERYAKAHDIDFTEE